MTAVWVRAIKELRARWRPWLAIAVMTGVAGGVVMAAAAGARRTDSAVPRPLLLIVVVIPAALVLGILIAAVPASTAARTEPALVLRTE
jgi:hypothetical protein